LPELAGICPACDGGQFPRANDSISAMRRIARIVIAGCAHHITRRVVYYNYPTSGIGGALVRLDNIASDNTDPAEADKFAAYGYLLA